MDTIFGVIILVVALAYGLFDVTKKETGCSAPEEEEENRCSDFPTPEGR